MKFRGMREDDMMRRGTRQDEKGKDDKKKRGKRNDEKRGR